MQLQIDIARKIVRVNDLLTEDELDMFLYGIFGSNLGLYNVKINNHIKDWSNSIVVKINLEKYFKDTILCKELDRRIPSFNIRCGKDSLIITSGDFRSPWQAGAFLHKNHSLYNIFISQIQKTTIYGEHKQ